MLIPRNRFCRRIEWLTLKEGAQFANAFTATLRRVELKSPALFGREERPRPSSSRELWEIRRGRHGLFRADRAQGGGGARHRRHVAVRQAHAAPSATRPMSGPSQRCEPAEIVGRSRAQAGLERACTWKAGNRVVIEIAKLRASAQIVPILRPSWPTVGVGSQRVEFSGTPLAEAMRS